MDVSDSDSVDSRELDEGLQKTDYQKKKSERSSNTNIKTTYRLGRLVNDEIHADGFTMKLEQSKF